MPFIITPFLGRCTHAICGCNFGILCCSLFESVHVSVLFIVFVLFLNLCYLLCKQLTRTVQTTLSPGIDGKLIFIDRTRTTTLTVLHDTASNGGNRLFEVSNGSCTFAELLVSLGDLVKRESRQTIPSRHHVVTLGTHDCLDRLTKRVSTHVTITL